MTKLEQTFTVDAPADVVWKALIDVERVAPCLPGAEVTENNGDGSYKGTFTVKLGPTTASYLGTLKMEDLDEAAHVATMSARGTDKRGQGGANATIVSTVGEDPDGGGTKVDVVTDFTITGKLARFGRGGMIVDVANRMLREFAANLEEEVQAGAPASPEATVVEGAADAAPGAEPVGASTGATGPGGTTSSSPPPGVAAPRATRAPAKPPSAIKILLGVIADRLKRLFSRGR